MLFQCCWSFSQSSSYYSCSLSLSQCCFSVVGVSASPPVIIAPAPLTQPALFQCCWSFSQSSSYYSCSLSLSQCCFSVVGVSASPPVIIAAASQSTSAVSVLLEFRNKYDRDPAISSLQTDKDLLAELRQTVTQQMKVDESVVAEDFFKCVLYIHTSKTVARIHHWIIY